MYWCYVVLVCTHCNLSVCPSVRPSVSHTAHALTSTGNLIHVYDLQGAGNVAYRVCCQHIHVVSDVSVATPPGDERLKHRGRWQHDDDDDDDDVAVAVWLVLGTAQFRRRWGKSIWLTWRVIPRQRQFRWSLHIESQLQIWVEHASHPHWTPQRYVMPAARAYRALNITACTVVQAVI